MASGPGSEEGVDLRVHATNVAGDNIVQTCDTIGGSSGAPVQDP
jgi:hypothetical protein